MALQAESHPTRSGRLFWGTAFVVLGGLLLLGHFGILNIEWESAWKFWPLVLILLGASLLLGSRPLKIIALVLAAIFAGLLFYSLSATFWSYHHWGERGGWVEREFSEPLEGAPEHASLVFESGAGTFTLVDTGEALFAASARSAVGDYVIERDRSSVDERIRLRLEKRPFVWGFGPGRNDVQMRVSSRPAWDLTFNIGASRLAVDGTPLRVDRLAINAGAADINVKLGQNKNSTLVKINCGASKVRISVPASAGCELHVNAPLSSKHFSEFEKLGGGAYRTDNFEEAESKINIDVQAGVSSLRVDRY